ncbi:MAG: two-component system, OmpR family, sensor kinase, partial [Sphingomonadales bacterium]|nr:two-component system, OmpR family, sensor kinase [Sphingomonadales bacterium]
VVPTDAYAEALAEYCRDRSESALYRASLLSQTFVESGLGPEDIIALHCESLDAVLTGRPAREQVLATGDAHQFLLEVMIAYGVKYKEFLELRLSQSLREAEARSSRERERTEDAERIGREKDEILAVIAHELRTPIAAARGSVDLAVRSLSKGRMDRVEPLLGTTRQALDRLSRLTGDLVEASRGVPAPIERRSQLLDSIVDQAYAWALPAAMAKGVELRRETLDSNVTVVASEDALLSVFGNLFSNAIRYTPAGGNVTLRQSIDQNFAVVEVTDTGIGMPAEVLTRIFDKFYRGPRARAVEAQGLGLGLALVQHFVDLHEGRLEVTSVDGAGSTFRVWLPCAAESEIGG